MQVGVPEVAQPLSAFRQDNACGGFAADDVGLVGVEGCVVEIGVRVGVVADLRAGVQPDLQKLGERARLPLRTSFALVHETRHGHSLGRGQA